LRGFVRASEKSATKKKSINIVDKQ